MADVSYTTSKSATAGVSSNQTVITRGAGTVADGVCVLHVSDTLTPAEALRLYREIGRALRRDVQAITGGTVEDIPTSGAITV